MKSVERYLNLLNLDIENNKIIAVVGGGGKTSLIYQLMQEIIDLGKTVIITTTTHMAYESDHPFARGGNPKQIKSFLEDYRYCIAAEYSGEIGKFSALKNIKLSQLRDLADVILVEADGAKHLPIKVPEKWEPVIPPEAEIVISVIGLDCLGKPIRETAHRMERTSEFLRKSLDAPITEEDVIQIATSICGLLKCVEDRTYRVYLNKVDVLSSKEPAKRIVKGLEEKRTYAAYGSLEKTMG